MAARFIEDPWHLRDPELLSMAPDPDPSSPFHRVPLTPIMDLQLDNLVIHNFLQPILKRITKRLDTLRQRVKTHGRQDWLETQLGFFILMNSLELAIAHDIDWACKRGVKVCPRKWRLREPRGSAC